MKIALAQIDCLVGDLDGNVERILAAARDAAARGAQLALFPELSLTGYPPRDLLNVRAFVRASEVALERLVRELPEGLIAIVGAPRAIQRAGAGSRELANAAVVLRRGAILLEVEKALLPTYDVFDERRYFEPAPPSNPRVFELGGERIGVTICEDMWNDRLLWTGHRLYERDPVAEAVEQGATLIVNVSASPFHRDKYLTRRRLVAHAAKRWRVPVVYTNSIGGQDGLLFDGGSVVYAAGGDLVAELPHFAEEVRVVDLSERAVAVEHDGLQHLADALVLGIRDYARKTGMERFLLGLSGGIDSALVAALGVLALGAEHGHALALPSRYSSEHSLTDARALATALHLPLQVVPIDPAHRAYEEMLAPVLEPLAPPPPNDVTFENVQARIRGATLMALANRTNGLLLTTGNKSECAVGYCTLYGDMCGGLAVIADLWKLEVYALSRWLDEHRLHGAIPRSTLEKAPSAELHPGQRDDQSLPPYEILDPILRCLVEEEMGVDEAVLATGAPVDVVRAMARKLFFAEYKRKQFAPTLRVSSRSWTGRDYPIAAGWKG